MAMFDHLIPGNEPKPGTASGGMFDHLIPPDRGDTSRGFQVSTGQSIPIAKGLVGLAGASAEAALGEGGISTAVKNWGLKGYQEGMEKLQPLQKDTDELTTAWERAKEGDIGALVDWLQYGLGYAAGQGGEALLTSLIGGVVGGASSGGLGVVPGALAGAVGKGAVKDAAKGLIEKAVVKEANALMAKGGAELTAAEAVKQATKNVASNIGSTGALLAYGTGQELGSIYPEAEAEAARKGEKLTGFDLARVWGSGLAAGGIEALTDKLGIDVAMGKLKLPGSGTGVGSRIGSGLKMGGAGIVTEAATEGLQTGIERFGAGQDITSPEGLKDIINSAGLGAVGGGAIGGGAGLLHGGKTANPAAVAKSNQAMDDLAAAETPDAAIEAFTNTHIPLNIPQNFDTEGAMARMERANAKAESLLRDWTGVTMPSVVPGESELGSPSAPTPEERLQAGVPESFQERLAVVREQLQDSRVRQQIRGTLGSTALGDAMHFANTADTDTLPVATADAMLNHAERLLDEAGVDELPRQTMATANAQSLAEKRLAAQAKIDEQNKTKETVAPAARTAEIAAAAAAPGAGLKERAAASSQRQKAALLTGNAVVNEQGLLEPLPAVDASTTPGANVAPAPSVIDQRAHEAAASPTNERIEPTSPQAEAGNYKKGHDATTFPGLDLSIENPEGSTRRDSKNEPPKWETKMAHHYGYIKGTKSIDGEHMDVFVKPGTPEGHTGPVFVVDQIVPGTGKPDEHKVMLGFDTLEEAKDAYRANYPKDWKGLRTISAAPFEEFKQWLATGDTSKPFHQPSLKERAEAMKARDKPVPTAAEQVATPEGDKGTVADSAKAETPVTPQTESVQTPAVADSASTEPEFDLGPTVKHTTGKGKDIFGYILRDATDAEARAIDPYTFAKDGGKFIREKHGDALAEFLQKRGPVAAPAAAAPTLPAAQKSEPVADITPEENPRELDDVEGTHGWKRLGYVEGNDGVSYGVDFRDILTRGGLTAVRQARIYDDNGARYMAAWEWSSSKSDAPALTGLRIDIATFHYTLSGTTDAAFGDDASDGDALWERYGGEIAAAIRRANTKAAPEAAKPEDETPKQLEAPTLKDRAAASSPVARFAAEMRQIPGMEMNGIDPRDWSMSVGESGEVHVRMDDHATRPTVYTISSFDKGEKISSLATAKFDDIAPTVAEKTADLLGVKENGPAVSANTIFTEDAAEKARAILRKKLGNINSGIDPELLGAGLTLAGYHLEKGARTFAAYAKAMIDDMGDGIKPYLKSFYMGIKYDPRASGFDGMSSAAEVEEFDLNAAGKRLDTPAAAAPAPAEPYAHLEGKTIDQKVTVADTGQTATLRMDAAETMRDLDKREAALLELQSCLKKAA